MASLIYKLFTVFLLMLSLGCSNKGSQESEPLARVFDKYLYARDLSGLVKPGTSATDSVMVLQSYIQDWVKHELMLAKAEDNLVIDKDALDKKLEDYRASLILYDYENELTKEKLDTNVTEQQLAEYYKTHADNFVLRYDIIRLRYVKILLKDKRLAQLRSAWADNSFSADRLDALCRAIAVKYNLNDSAWISLDEVGNIIPKTIQGGVLGATGSFERSDSAYMYLMNIKEYKAVGSIAPMSFEKENIYKILVNKRKVDLIKNIKEEIFKHAFEHKDFEIFSNRNKVAKPKK